MTQSTINPIIIFIWKNRFRNLILSIIFLIASFLIVLLGMDKQYTAVVSIIPPSGSSSSMGKLGALAGLAGLGSIGNSGLSQDMNRGILESKALQYRLLQTEFSYKEHGKPESGKLIDLLDIDSPNPRELYEKAYKAFAEEILFTDIDADNNILYLNVTLKSPVLAALVANKMVEYLDDIVKKQIVNEYREQSQYIRSRIRVISDSLKMSENAYKKFMEQTREADSPEYTILDMQFQRQLTVLTTILSELQKQKELLVMNNMFTLSPIKVLDRAEPPFRKSRPKRLLTIISIFSIFIFLQLLINSFIVLYRNFKTNVIARINE